MRLSIKWKFALTDKVKCNLCDSSATHYSIHAGCYYCGGLDCGDTPYVGLYCETHARFFNIEQEQRINEKDSVDKLYDLLDNLIEMENNR